MLQVVQRREAGQSASLSIHGQNDRNLDEDAARANKGKQLEGGGGPCSLLLSFLVSPSHSLVLGYIDEEDDDEDDDQAFS